MFLCLQSPSFCFYFYSFQNKSCLICELIIFFKKGDSYKRKETVLFVTCSLQVDAGLKTDCDFDRQGEESWSMCFVCVCGHLAADKVCRTWEDDCEYCRPSEDRVWKLSTRSSAIQLDFLLLLSLSSLVSIKMLQKITQMPKSPLKYSTHHHHYNVGNMLRVVHSTPSFFLVYDCGLLLKKSTNVHFRPFYFIMSTKSTAIMYTVRMICAKWKVSADVWRKDDLILFTIEKKKKTGQYEMSI